MSICVFCDPDQAELVVLCTPMQPVMQGPWGLNQGAQRFPTSILSVAQD